MKSGFRADGHRVVALILIGPKAAGVARTIGHLMGGGSVTGRVKPTSTREVELRRAAQDAWTRCTGATNIESRRGAEETEPELNRPSIPL